MMPFYVRDLSTLGVWYPQGFWNHPHPLHILWDNCTDLVFITCKIKAKGSPHHPSTGLSVPGSPGDLGGPGHLCFPPTAEHAGPRAALWVARICLKGRAQISKWIYISAFILSFLNYYDFIIIWAEKRKQKAWAVFHKGHLPKRIWLFFIDEAQFLKSTKGKNCVLKKGPGDICVVTVHRLLSCLLCPRLPAKLFKAQGIQRAPLCKILARASGSAS